MGRCSDHSHARFHAIRRPPWERPEWDLLARGNSQAEGGSSGGSEWAIPGEVQRDLETQQANLERPVSPRGSNGVLTTTSDLPKPGHG